MEFPLAGGPSGGGLFSLGHRVSLYLRRRVAIQALFCQAMPMPTFSRSSLVATLVATASLAFAGGALAATALFVDVPADHWAASAISSVKEAGLMNGSNGRFRPNDGVTRAELAVVADRLLKKMNGGGEWYPPVPEPADTPADADDDMVLGDNDATITIIEFSDYQCPFCKRFHDQTFPSIKENYIDKGLVRFVYRDFPLSFHPGAYPAAVAVECAHNQGNSIAWKLHNAIFANQNLISSSGDVDENLKELAHDISGLNDDTFDRCYDNDDPADEIQADTDAAVESGINGTPGFWVLGPGGQAEKISGAVPYETFKDAIDRMLP